MKTKNRVLDTFYNSKLGITAELVETIHPDYVRDYNVFYTHCNEAVRCYKSKKCALNFLEKMNFKKY